MLKKLLIAIFGVVLLTGNTTLFGVNNNRISQETKEKIIGLYRAGLHTASALVLPLAMIHVPGYLMKGESHPLVTSIAYASAWALAASGANRQLNDAENPIAQIGEWLPFIILGWKGFWLIDKTLAKSLSAAGIVASHVYELAPMGYFKLMSGLNKMLQH